MLCIRSHNPDPYFNLAAEEYLLRNTDEEILMLWKSNPVVVCGKHQNVYAEMNYTYVTGNDIRVARRLTGGGTVFHDPGNINFTFIKNGKAGALVQFSQFIAPVIDFLNEWGIAAIQGPKHDILVQGKKISGNAEHVYKNRVLHHGTLLYDANLDMLRKSIQRTQGMYIDKSVQSNRSSVMNLSSLMPADTSNEHFFNEIFSYLKNRSKGIDYQLNTYENTSIQQLAENKYLKWEWIYGWSPDYTFKNQWKSENHSLQIEFDVHKGIITASRWSGTWPSIRMLNQKLIGNPHQEKDIRNMLLNAGIQDQLNAVKEFEDLIYACF